MLTDLRLDSPGIAALLKSGPFQAAVHAIAEGIAADVRGSIEEGVEVVVDDYTTDRAASSVTIKDARGMLWQASDGVLTRAASGAGLEVGLYYTTKAGKRRRASAAQIANWSGR